MRIELMS